MYMHARYTLIEAPTRFFKNNYVKLKFRSKLQVLMDRRGTLLFTDYGFLTFLNFEYVVTRVVDLIFFSPACFLLLGISFLDLFSFPRNKL